MNVYKRYFKVTEGVLFDKVKVMLYINSKAQKQFLEIAKEIGAESRYFQSNNVLTGFIFKETPDMKLFKNIGKIWDDKKLVTGWFPKQNTKFGKELAKRINYVEVVTDYDCLVAVGLNSFATIVANGKWYRPTLSVIPSKNPVAYVQIPWYDEDPEVLEKYKIDNENNIQSCGNLDAILYEIPKEFIEIKSWEVDKAIDEWNETIKEK